MKWKLKSVNMRPWKVMMWGCCVKDYKSKSAAIRRARILKAHSPSDSKVCVSSAFEVIEI